ncbi:MAG: carbon starvation protein A [Akkermansia sp.]|nr:carbon starvation protein A [Akkermansia sp.]
MTGLLVFFLCAALLVAGYFVYGRLAERVYGLPHETEMPCVAHPDGVDFVPLPTWKIFLIQLLNIAGLGPVVGAVSGCLFGPAALLWIVIGCIFAGAMHDFLAARMSADADGANLPELVGENLGRPASHAMRTVCVGLLLLVGVVFTLLPAGMLHGICPGVSEFTWSVIIITYYFLATILPINVIIGRIYPIFGALFLFMAAGLGIMLPVSGYEVLPCLDFFTNMHPAGQQIWPALFVTIACGAISGFHATQSPMMVRCLPDAFHMRRVFYGAMIVEGMVALVWATVGLTLRDMLVATPDGGEAIFYTLKPAVAVTAACNLLLGHKCALFAVLGVVVLAVSSGDTAMRSCRLMLSDLLHLEQRVLWKRLALALPIFATVIILSNVDFSIVWRYFGWANQALSCITLWSITVCLRRRGRGFWLSLPPALFMTVMCTTFLFAAPECGIELPMQTATLIGLGFTALLGGLFALLAKNKGNGAE